MTTADKALKAFRVAQQAGRPWAATSPARAFQQIANALIGEVARITVRGAWSILFKDGSRITFKVGKWTVCGFYAEVVDK